MGTLLVVVAHIGVQDALDVPAADEQEPIKAFASHGPHPAFGIGVGSRCSHRGADDADALGGETWSKVAVNLVSRSRIRNSNPCRFCSTRSPTRFRATWVTQGPVGCAVTPRKWTLLVASSITKST